MTYIPSAKIFQSGRVTGLSIGTAGVVSGTTSMADDTITTTQHSFTFPVPFDEVPGIDICLDGNSSGHADVTDVKIVPDSITTTGFTALISTTGSSNAGGFVWAATRGI